MDLGLGTLKIEIYLLIDVTTEYLLKWACQKWS